ALEPPAAQARVVVDEADDVLARRLAQLAEQAAAAAAGAHDQRAPLSRPALHHDEGTVERSLAEARGADEDRAEEPVDDEDALREVAPRLRRRDEDVGDELGEA